MGRIREVLGYLSIIFAVAITITATVLLAIPDDGRLNLQAHFGGDALYCVDANMVPVGNYSATDGGFRVLKADGNELLFIPTADIDAAIADATTLGVRVLVGSGTGTYGPAALYVEIRDGIPVFTYVGWDEHGKENQLEFANCEPVGEPEKVVGSPAEPSICSVDEINDAFLLREKETVNACAVLVGCPEDGNLECLCEQYPGFDGCEGRSHSDRG
jgi:hypothetical protein